MGTMTSAAHREVAAKMSERQLDEAIRQLCAGFGLLRYHTADSRRSPSGYPDLTITGPRGLLFRELKATRGYTSAAQSKWLDVLAKHADAAVWTPHDLLSGRIARELRAVSAL